MCRFCKSMILTIARRARGAMQKDASVSVGGWAVESRKSPIMRTADMEAFALAHAMPSLPEMIHGGAGVVLRHGASGAALRFSPLEALVEWRRTCFERPAPKVAQARDWSLERADTLADIPSVEYDWTFLVRPFMHACRHVTG